MLRLAQAVLSFSQCRLYTYKKGSMMTAKSHHRWRKIIRGARSATACVTFAFAAATTAISALAAPYTGTPISLPATFEAENFDKGGQGVGYRDLTPGNSGGQYRLSESVDIRTSRDAAGGGYVIGWIQAGEWMAYTINIPT
jgi:hypothetical protein